MSRDKRRLGRHDADRPQAPSQLFLVANRLASEQIEDERLPPCLHIYAAGRMSIHEQP